MKKKKVHCQSFLLTNEQNRFKIKIYYFEDLKEGEIAVDSDNRCFFSVVNEQNIQADGRTKPCVDRP